MKYSNGTITQCYAYHYNIISELVSCAFSTIPICPFLIQRIFHSLVIIQVNEKFFELKGTYRDRRKSTGNKLEYWYT